MKEENLVFIVSLPRSGSTYLQSLLSNNDEVNTCSEPWILLNYLNQIKPSLVQTEVNNQFAVDAFDHYRSMYPDFEFENLKKEYLLNLYSPMLKGHKYIIDKTPRYWEILEEIRELFPNSKMLILKRNPVKVAESIFKTWNVDTLERMLIFKRDLLHGPFAIKSFEDKHAGKPTIYFLSYEKLINNTEIEVEKLYRWLGTPFDKDFLKVQNNRKVQGKYGDPFLNSELGYTAAKRKSDLIELNNIQQKFLHGYADFLGEKFLSEYGNYIMAPQYSSKSFVFSHYLYKSDLNEPVSFNEKVNNLFRDNIYTILKKIL